MCQRILESPNRHPNKPSRGTAETSSPRFPRVFAVPTAPHQHVSDLEPVPCPNVDAHRRKLTTCRAVIVTDAIPRFKCQSQTSLWLRTYAHVRRTPETFLPLVGPGVGLVRTTQVSDPILCRTSRRIPNTFDESNANCAGEGRLSGPPDLRFHHLLRARSGIVRLGSHTRTCFRCVWPQVSCSCSSLSPFSASNRSLYDVFVKRSGNRLRITSRSNVFLRNVIEANQTITQ